MINLKVKLLVTSFLSLFSIYLFLALLSLDVGIMGTFMKDNLLKALGLGSYIVPFYLGYLVVEVLTFSRPRRFKVYSRLTALALWLVVFVTLCHQKSEETSFFLPSGSMGGKLGQLIYDQMVYYLGKAGTWLLLISVAILATYLVGEGRVFRKAYAGLRNLHHRLFRESRQVADIHRRRPTKEFVFQGREKDIPENAISDSPTLQETSLPGSIFTEEVFTFTEESPKSTSDFESRVAGTPEEKPVPELSDQEIGKGEKRFLLRAGAKPKKTTENSQKTGWTLPPTHLLDYHRKGRAKEKNLKTDITKNILKLEQTLSEFSVPGKVISVQVGPTITRYEFQPAPGIKVNKIVNLSNDIALAFAAAAVRIEAPIPGKAAVGIEIPNSYKEIVSLRELVESSQFRDSKSPLQIALGKSVTGEPLIWDLREAPHLLIAGATGSGKSVCINAILMSLLFRADPNQLRIALVDPKRVELSIYQGLPHLCAPVISEVRKTVKFLKWLCREMEQRYDMLSDLSVRNIEEYNYLVSEEEKLPYVVIVIDELADLMMTASSEVETSICRLAQMARAVGMHLVVATQRPSVDVITGLIKANFPSRLAFAVSSQADSKTILDGPGAEKLLGNGDFLFSPVGANKPIRGQGSFVSTREAKRVIEHWLVQKEQGKIFYSFNFNPREEIVEESSEEDELYQEAVKVVVEAGRASTSLLQRRLRIGFNRAARMIERMEREGIVGPYEGSKSRKVIIGKKGGYNA